MPYVTNLASFFIAEIYRFLPRYCSCFNGENFLVKISRWKGVEGNSTRSAGINFALGVIRKRRMFRCAKKLHFYARGTNAKYVTVLSRRDKLQSAILGEGERCCYCQLLCSREKRSFSCKIVGTSREPKCLGEKKSFWDEFEIRGVIWHRMNLT